VDIDDAAESLQKQEVFLAVLDAIPEREYFGVQYDPSNAIVAGDDPVALLESVADRVVSMHASDRYLVPGASLEELRQSDGTLGYFINKIKRPLYDLQRSVYALCSSKWQDQYPADGEAHEGRADPPVRARRSRRGRLRRRRTHSTGKGYTMSGRYSRRQLFGAAGAGIVLAGRAVGAPKPIRGIFPILATPYTTAKEIDYEDLVAEAGFLDRCGVHGMVWPLCQRPGQRDRIAEPQTVPAVQRCR
jgi:hypothetical protein